mgnify:CR=1 FL=1
MQEPDNSTWSILSELHNLLHMVRNKINNNKILINTIIRNYIIYTYQDQKNLN